MEDLFSSISVEEDCLNYLIVPVDAITRDADCSTEELELLRERVLAIVHPHTEHYLWNHGGFELYVDPDGEGKLLNGSTIFGDAIDDEWFVVWLLKRVTEEIPSLAIMVWDTDGQFLLAEAALELPGWIKPENSDNRVFIYSGHLHIIPESVLRPSDSSKKLWLKDAVRLLGVRQDVTITPQNIEAVAFERLAGFPDKSRQAMHHAKCILPVRAAKLLKHNPQLVASAVDVFYTRDPIQLKACSKMRNFPPTQVVKTTVKFHRVQYAKLMGQSFNAPRVFSIPRPDDPDYKPAVLGMKVACSFEMLYAEKSEVKRSGHDAANVSDDKAFVAFVGRLKKLGYFDGALEGSEAYKKKLQTAKEFFKPKERQAAITTIAHRQCIYGQGKAGGDTIAGGLAEGHLLAINEIDRLLELPDPPSPSDLVDNSPEDSDDWLAISPDYLEEVLQKAKEKMSQGQDDYSDEERYRAEQAAATSQRQQELDEMVETESSRRFESTLEQIKQFLERESNLEGVRFEDDPEISDEEIQEPSDEDIDFDPDGMIDILRSIIGADSLGSEMDADERAAQDTSHSISAFMSGMDAELAKTKVGESFIKEDEIPGHADQASVAASAVEGSAAAAISDRASAEQASEDEEDEYREVNIDLNLAHNILSSFKSQEGLPGPAGNLLSSLKFQIPHDIEDRAGIYDPDNSSGEDNRGESDKK
ncbi:hypothetical protein EV182_001476 [Spiromyces aspiralis]|uniref:Uncharacterized protein n=1 Tax=Spiromyces aspiralis TaxID=68401 RepID=A0ACC1HHW9_9FUNG|nr:hypothetical protein EV182_001476 [Spiromyces aspiralis]